MRKQNRDTSEIVSLPFPKAVSTFFRLAAAAGSRQASFAKEMVEKHPRYECFDANDRETYDVIADALLKAYNAGVEWGITCPDSSGRKGRDGVYSCHWMVHRHTGGDFKPTRFVRIELSGYYVLLQGRYSDVRELVKKADLLKDLPKGWLRKSRY